VFHGGAPSRRAFTAGPHSGTTFDIMSSVGVAILMIAGVPVTMDRLLRLRRLAKPVVAVGTMSLTAYVGHFVVQPWLSELGVGPGTEQSWVPLLMFVLGAIVFAAIWSRFFRRGPLEYLVNAAAKPASTSDGTRPGWKASTSHPGGRLRESSCH
jgi:uncharacterized membrane protein YeiB